MSLTVRVLFIVLFGLCWNTICAQGVSSNILHIVRVYTFHACLVYVFIIIHCEY